MADEETPKPVRKINPALLLKTAQAQERSRPVVETTNFGARTRSDWRNKPSAAPAKLPAIKPVEGTPASTNKGSEEGTSTSDTKLGTDVAGTEERSVIPNPMLKKDEVEEELLKAKSFKLNPTRRINPAFADASSDDVDENGEPVATESGTKPSTLPVQPAKRRVASRFSLEEEEPDIEDEVEDDSDEDAPVDLNLGSQGKIVRPNFMTGNDRVGNTSSNAFAKKGNAAVRPHYTTKIDSNVEATDWDDDESTDTAIGLGAEVDNGYVEPQFARGFHLTERDIIIMKFLARYRYAYTDQLARLVDTMPRAIITRMTTLEKRGFVRKQPITERQYLWMTRKAGNLIADIAFGEIKKGTVSYATIAHTIGLANLGVELEREEGGKDILGERQDPDDEPPKSRYKLGLWGNPEGKTYGEMTVTEREIRQGQMRWRGGRSTAEMRELVEFAVMDTEEQQELLEGNEGLFVVYGLGADGEHIPDLVVARPRDENNKPMHIAIELELTGKPSPQWKRILRWYRDNGIMYDKIVYFTHKRSIATALRRADDEVGLGDRLVIRKYLPVNNRMPFWG
jgi:hypothetical protein